MAAIMQATPCQTLSWVLTVWGGLQGAGWGRREVCRLSPPLSQGCLAGGGGAWGARLGSDRPRSLPGALGGAHASLASPCLPVIPGHTNKQLINSWIRDKP